MKKALILGLFCSLAAASQAGRLLDPQGLAAGSNPRGLVSVDFDADGFADAAVANFGSATLIGQACPAEAGSISLYKGSANGLQAGQVLALDGDAPRGLAVVDVNGDGRSDLLATLYCSGRLAVFLQGSDGAFAAPSFVAVGSQPVGVATLAGPGQAWVAVANYGSSSVSVFNAREGSLMLLATLAAGANPTDLEFYAPAGAQAPLLLVANYSANSISRISLTASGAQSQRVDLPVAGQPCKIVTGDLDGDGLADAAVARFTDSAISVFRGLPGGGLASEASSVALKGSHPNGMAIGKLGASLRLVAADRDSDHAEVVSWAPAGLSSSAAILVPDAAGNTATYGPVEAAIGDINGDGFADVLLTHMRTGRLIVLQQGPAAAPLISSSSHPDPQGWSASTQLEAAWQAGDDLDPISQYLVLVDDAPGSVPTAAQSAASVSVAGLSTGVHYLHVRAVDASGRAGETAHYRIGVTAQMARENVYNYPNPTRDGRTSIRFPLLAPAGVEVRIYDEVGGLVWSRDLSAAETQAGVNTLEWDGRNGNGRQVANGGYILTVNSGGIQVTKKVAVIR